MCEVIPVETDWLPDWRDKTAYPKPRDLSFTQWAWQFLRRNSEYQADYAKWRTLFDSLGGDREPLMTIEDDLRFWVCDPPAYDNETYAEYRKRVGRDFRGYTALWAVLCGKYGLGTALPVPDPCENVFRASWFRTEGLVCTSGVPGLDDRRVVIEPSDFEIFIRFNLEWPIKVQLRRAQELLERQKAYYKKHELFEPISKRNRITRFPFYVRLLDARSSGAKITEIAAVLLSANDNSYPDYIASKNIRNSLKAAQKLRDQEYLFIPLGRAK